MSLEQRMKEILGFVAQPMRAAAMFAVITQTACAPDPSATEKSLRKQFVAKENTLNKIVEMQLQDAKVVRIAPTFTRLENDWSWPRKDIGFSEARWNEYRAIFIAADVSGTHKDGESISIDAGSTTHGFLYTPKVPSRIVSSFSECDFAKNGKDYRSRCYIFIKNNWYLFLG